MLKFIFLLLLLPAGLFGIDLDSLKNAADKTSGDKKIGIILQISEHPGIPSNGERIKIAQYALSLAEKMNYQAGIAASINRIGTIQYNIREYDNSRVNLFKSLSIYKKLGDSAKIGKIFNQVGLLCERLYKYDSALIFHKYALKCLERHGERVDYAAVSNNIALIIWRNGAFAEALPYFETALEIRKSLKNDKLIGMSYNNIGTLYWRWGNYEKALENFNQALRYRETTKDTHGYVLTLNNIGLVYQRINQLDKALELYDEAIQLSNKNKFPFGKAYTYHNMGQLYNAKKDFTKALECSQLSLENYRLIRERGGEISALNSMGEYNENLGRFSQAFNNYQKALETAITLEDRYSTSQVYFNLGRVSNKMKEIEKSIGFVDQCLSMALKQGLKELVKESYYLQSKNYALLKDYKRSLDYMNLYNEIKDSLYNEKLITDLSNWRIKYETEKKIIENNMLRDQNSRIQDEIAKQKFLTRLLILASLIILIIVAFVYRLYYLKKKTNLELIEHRNKLETLNVLLDNQNKELLETNKTKNKLFSIIGHDLRNPFQALVGYSEILISDFDNLDDNLVKTYIRNINESSKSLLSLTRNLLDWAMVQSEKLAIKPEIINVKSLIDELISAYNFNIVQKRLSVQNEVTEDIAVLSDAHMFSTIVRNLLSNAIKFTPHNGHVKVWAEPGYSETIFCVEDNGIGLSAEEIEKLFNVNTNFSKKGTDLENGTGLGLILCKDLVEKNGGKIWIESIEGKGSKFKFSVPNAAY